jgi:hypothetical protein
MRLWWGRRAESQEGSRAPIEVTFASCLVKRLGGPFLANKMGRAATNSHFAANCAVRMEIGHNRAQALHVPVHEH